MNKDKGEKLQDTAESLRDTAERVEDGIANVLQPEMKYARVSADDARETMVALAKRVVLLFAGSVFLNAATIIFVLLNR